MKEMDEAEFERVFKATDEEVTDAMVEGIQEAFTFYQFQ